MEPLISPFLTEADTAEVEDSAIRRMAVLTLLAAVLLVGCEWIALFVWINR